MKKIRLINTQGTSNKFYIMQQTPSSTGEWMATYGSLNRPASVTKKVYASQFWGVKLTEKLKKGYVIDSEIEFEDIFSALDKLEAQLKLKNHESR